MTPGSDGERVNETHDIHRTVVENLDAVLWVVDPRTGVVEFASPAQEAVFGFRLEGPFPDLDMVVPEDRPAVEAAMAAMNAGSTAGYEFRVQAPGAAPRWIEMRARPLRDASGAIVRLVGASTDVTQRRIGVDSLRRSEERLQALLAGGWDAVYVFDAAGKITFVSESTRRTFGIEPASRLGGHALERFHPDDRERGVALLREITTTPGARAKIEARLRRDDGTYSWAEIAAVNLIDAPAVGGVVVNAREISDRKRAELEQAERAAELERRVAERTAELAAANAALERAARAKDEFLAHMSHELRTPLNAILGLTELLREEVHGPVSEKQRVTLGRIEESGQHLLSLIGDVLDLAKVEAGRAALDVGPVDVADLCRASLRLVQEAAKRKRLQVSFRAPVSAPTLVADGRRLKQVLVNLLSNAVKFTPPGGRVGIDADVEGDGEEARFVVWDTGVGIDGADVPRLFQPFVQLDAGLAREHGGTGLGLALVRRLVELHGGRVGVESERGKGARFTITLPLTHAGSRPPGSRPAPPSPGPRRSAPSPAGELHTTSPSPAPPDARPSRPSRAEELSGPTPRSPVAPPSADSPSPLGVRPHAWRILLAEDDEINVSTVADFLRMYGHQVDVARDGRQAVDMARAQRPDLVLMDIQMPVMDGIAAIRALRSDPELRTVPIVALTALAMPGDRERCLAAGADEHVVKPVGLRQLQALIQARLG